jgi:hypothetical protein
MFMCDFATLISNDKFQDIDMDNEQLKQTLNKKSKSTEIVQILFIF